MNDPGLEEPLNETQKRVEQDRKEEEDFEQEEEQTFLNPRSNPQRLPIGNFSLKFSVTVDGGLLQQHFPCLLYVNTVILCLVPS